MRYRLPEDCAGVSHAGLALTPAPDGTVEADAAAADALAPHGLVPVTMETAVPCAPPRRNRTDDRRMLR